MSGVKTIELVDSICCACGTHFAMEETVEKLRRNDGAVFWCPNGHAQHFTMSSVERMKTVTSQRDEALKELEDYKTQVRQLKCALLQKEQARKTIRNGFGLLG